MVDDIDAMVVLLAFIFRKRGYQVFTASEGKTGLQLARSIIPDAAILNFSMPEMSGIEMLRRIRADQRTRKLKTVITSGSPRVAAMALEAGAKGFIRVPFNVADIVEIVERSLRARE